MKSRNKGLTVNAVSEEPLGTLRGLTYLDASEMTAKFSGILLVGENIQQGFKGLKDTVIITDKRIILSDSSGKSSKVFYESIFLHNLIAVDIEAIKADVGDTKLQITYSISPTMKGVVPKTRTKNLEFNKGMDIKTTYLWLLAIVYNTSLRLNS